MRLTLKSMWHSKHFIKMNCSIKVLCIQERSKKEHPAVATDVRSANKKGDPPPRMLSQWLPNSFGAHSPPSKHSAWPPSTLVGHAHLCGTIPAHSSKRPQTSLTISPRTAVAGLLLWGAWSWTGAAGLTNSPGGGRGQNSWVLGGSDSSTGGQSRKWNHKFKEFR